MYNIGDYIRYRYILYDHHHKWGYATIKNIKNISGNIRIYITDYVFIERSGFVIEKCDKKEYLANEILSA